MISVNEAIEIVKSNANIQPPVKMDLKDAAGLILARELFANYSIPNFNQSAMDGYAFRYHDLLKSKELYVSHEIAAGETNILTIPELNAVRIFTGAPVPKELDTVVMREKVELQNGKIKILDEGLIKGSNVRLKGSEINKGERALAKDSLLSPAAIGFLAGVGITEVLVYPKPSVSILITGKELVKSGEELQPGQVFESNSLLLQSALKQLHINNIRIEFIDDDLEETKQAIKKALTTSDLILLTGGVSVGNYDFVVEAAEACGVEQLFHKLKQRPGKPLYCGISGEKIIFGLPGNPASVLSCFYNYVVVAIECMTGRKNLIQKRWLPLSTSLTKKIKLTQFLKAIHNDETVTPLSAQESFRLSSFSLANCLIILPEEKLDFVEGELVETVVLPYL